MSSLEYLEIQFSHKTPTSNRLVNKSVMRHLTATKSKEQIVEKNHIIYSDVKKKGFSFRLFADKTVKNDAARKLEFMDATATVEKPFQDITNKFKGLRINPL